MKTNAPHSCLLPRLALVLALTAATLHANNNEEAVFGSELSIHGLSYSWQGPATESGNYRTDTYYSYATGHSVTVTSKLDQTSLAIVSGSDWWGSISGYLSNGSYSDSSSSSSGSASYSYQGYQFDHVDSTSSASVDLDNGTISYSGQDYYTGPQGSYSYTYNNGGASPSWSYSASLGNSGTSSYPASSTYSHDLFGTNYAFQDGSWSSSYSASGDSWGSSWSSGSSGWQDQYRSSDGGTLTVQYSSWQSNSSWTSDSVSISGWDPYAGSFSASYNGSYSGFSGLIWQPRTAPTFAPPQLWLNGQLLTWQSGEINQSGTVTDTYGDSAGAPQLRIAGHTRNFAQSSGSASVELVSQGFIGYWLPSGAYESGGNSWELRTSSPSTTHATPFFRAVTSLWLGGTEYVFSQGTSDGHGSRTDSYVNSSAGTITLAGSSGSPEQTSITAGYFDQHLTGGFSSSQELTTTLSNGAVNLELRCMPPVPAAPPALWVRGTLFTHSSTNGDQTEMTSAGGHRVTLGPSGVAGELALWGSDPRGVFQGSFNASQAGLMMVQNADGGMVPLIPANADGTLQLAGVTPPGGFPPAVMVADGRIWTFVGTALDDSGTNVSAAFYGSATAPADNPWLLKLRQDGGGVADCTDYGSGATTQGTYNTQTHLFQTSGPGSGFPVPIYGVEPAENHRLWGLATPEGGLPATFLVGGGVWRYSGTDGSGQPRYEGYYTGQQLVVAAPDAGGNRLVTVSDPVAGDSMGTLNDVRGTVRLRDGRVVYSGSFEGQRLNPTLQENAIHTIAADLDVTGNVFSLGALQGDAATAGTIFQFADTGSTASLHSIVSRPQAQWEWWKAGGSPEAALQPVMQLGADHVLRLHDPGSGQPGVVLDPRAGGVSSIKGVLRVRPGGDLSMGAFTQGPQP